MIALAILAGTLVVLLDIITNNIRATNHSKLTTAATFLARGKMVEIESLMLHNGFSENNESESGSFKDQGFPQFDWDYIIERIELPTDALQKGQEAAADAKDSKDPMAAMTGMVGGLMSSFIDPIRIGLQESVRRVTLRVVWDEVGRPDQSLEVITFLTDPAKLDLALTGGGLGAGMPPGATGVPGPGGAGGPGGQPRMPAFGGGGQ
jgi:hypothetical protein